MEEGEKAHASVRSPNSSGKAEGPGWGGKGREGRVNSDRPLERLGWPSPLL